MIDVLISIIILAVVFGLIFYLVQMLPIPEPFAMIVRVAVILIAILLVVSVAFGGVSVPLLHYRR
jgi:hypothetical protein